jgi:predicted DNA-binding WGR domain protein
MLLGDEGQVSKAECTCTLFRKQGLKTGPCTHLIALRLAYAQRETERAKGSDPKQIITVETRSYSRRNESGEEVYQVSLEKERLRVQWGKAGQNLRQQTLQFNTVDEARSAYFARINELVGKGFLSTTD